MLATTVVGVRTQPSTLVLFRCALCLLVGRSSALRAGQGCRRVNGNGVTRAAGSGMRGSGAGIWHMTGSHGLPAIINGTHDSCFCCKLRDASCRVVTAEHAAPFGPVAHFIRLVVGIQQRTRSDRITTDTLSYVAIREVNERKSKDGYKRCLESPPRPSLKATLEPIASLILPHSRLPTNVLDFFLFALHGVPSKASAEGYWCSQTVRQRTASNHVQTWKRNQRKRA